LEVFTFDRRPHASPASTRFIYDDAWAEFDKLESKRERNAVSWARWLAEMSFCLSSFAFAFFLKRYLWAIFAAWSFLFLLELGYRWRLRRQFMNWQCPRCGTKWPGTAQEKESTCNACGLRLHQLEP
jgi:hypothetical protein